MTPRNKDRAQWYRVDLHIHTPASADYHQPTISYLDILQRAELRGIDILAFTDHNTVAGYAAMMREIEQLEFLVSRGRAAPDEQRLLAEYRRLLNNILVLPGFEITATFGFHILGIFPPEMSIRRLEHLLLDLRVPYDAVERGLTEVGASSDVLAIYRAVRDAGGICIAAHVNAAHGVAMWNLDFGGQTRIAYTQDHNLHALEVTDLGKRGRHVTQSFFDGSKPEYPRRMRCIQGSDAHRLDSQIDKRGRIINFGVGERATEMRLSERSFDGLLELLESGDFTSSRPYLPGAKPEDAVLAARAEGPNLVQCFHESATQGGVLRYNILTDICAFANTHGGTLYLGLGAEPMRMPAGIDNPQALIEQVTRAADLMLVPPLELVIDTPETQGRTIVRIQVPRGPERPYALENSKIFVRSGAETVMATRDQIIALIVENQAERDKAAPAPARTEYRQEPPTPTMPAPEAQRMPRDRRPERRPEPRRERERERPPVREAHTPRPETPPARPTPVAAQPLVDELPRIGVEIVSVEPRGALNVYALRDLQTGSVIKNVTRMSASKLWRYVIKQHETNPVQLDQVRWNGSYGLWRKYRRLVEVRYDLVLKTPDGVRYFYGVPESELKGGFAGFISAEAQPDEATTAPPSSARPSVTPQAEGPQPDTDGAEAVGVGGTQIQPSADGESAVAPAKRRRRRRGGRRRRPAGETAAPAVEVEPEPAPVEAAPVAEAESPAPVKKTAPKKRRTTQKAAAEAAPVTAAPVMAEAAPAAEVAPTEEKPVEKTTRRRKTKAEAAANAPAPEPESEAPAAKPKTTTRRKKSE